MTNPIKQLEVAAKAAPGIANAIKGLVSKDFNLSGEMVAPKTRFNRVISPHRDLRVCPSLDARRITHDQYRHANQCAQHRSVDDGHSLYDAHPGF